MRKSKKPKVKVKRIDFPKRYKHSYLNPDLTPTFVPSKYGKEVLRLVNPSKGEQKKNFDYSDVVDLYEDVDIPSAVELWNGISYPAIKLFYLYKSGIISRNQLYNFFAMSKEGDFQYLHDRYKVPSAIMERLEEAYNSFNKIFREYKPNDDNRVSIYRGYTFNSDLYKYITERLNYPKSLMSYINDIYKKVLLNDRGSQIELTFLEPSSWTYDMNVANTFSFSGFSKAEELGLELPLIYTQQEYKELNVKTTRLYGWLKSGKSIDDIRGIVLEVLPNRNNFRGYDLLGFGGMSYHEEEVLIKPTQNKFLIVDKEVIETEIGVEDYDDPEKINKLKFISLLVKLKDLS